MGAVFAADAATGAAACVLALAAAVQAMGFLRRQHRRYGRLAAWPGIVAAAVPVTGLGLLAYAVYPLPPQSGLSCTGGGAAPAFAPLEALATPGVGAVHAVAAAGALVPPGVLLAYRYRRGVLSAVVLCALLAAGIEALQFTGLLGAYPCPYRVAAADDVLLGALGGLLGWLLGAAGRRVLPRAWPGAVADFLPPGLGRRLLARGLDLAVCYYGACAAAAIAVPLIGEGAAPGSQERMHAAALVALALVFGAVVPMLRRDRATPGQAACYLALSGAGRPHPAPRPRSLLRHALIWGPVAALMATGLEWWILAVAALHGSCALVRGDNAGLFDLIARTRLTTRAAARGGLPDELMRFQEPPSSPLPAAVGTVAE